MVKTNKAKISIVVPIYNVELYLERCVESLLGQTQTAADVEILLIDDGSPDSSPAICDRYAERYPDRISVCHKPNGGLSDARNYGLSKASGKYVLFVDSDDFLPDDACACLLSQAERFDAQMTIGRVKPIKDNPVFDRWEAAAREHLSEDECLTGERYLETCLHHFGLRVEIYRTLFLREFLLENDLVFAKGLLHEDEEFTPRALLVANRVAVCHHVTYNYDNTRENSIMHSAALSPKRLSDYLEIIDRLSMRYESVRDRKVRRRLQDDLCWKYLELNRKYRLYDKKDFDFHKWRTLKQAYTLKRRIKALVFAISPRLHARLF